MIGPDVPDEELPAVRGRQESKFGFTEKKYAHLPARESLLREPIYPISNQPIMRVVRVNGEDVEPVWLKQKGDHMYQRGNYKWSVTEYTKCLQADEGFMMARLNRAANYMRLREYEAALLDLDDIIS